MKFPCLRRHTLCSVSVLGYPLHSVCFETPHSRLVGISCIASEVGRHCALRCHWPWWVAISFPLGGKEGGRRCSPLVLNVHSSRFTPNPSPSCYVLSVHKCMLLGTGSLPDSQFVLPFMAVQVFLCLLKWWPRLLSITAALCHPPAASACGVAPSQEGASFSDNLVRSSGDQPVPSPSTPSPSIVPNQVLPDRS